ncbi:hypothetical protein JTB14_002806 [Gonioctena quinquepunctata]|nr:hypothetical protein JTB14_002806 [Gonioctena quinquepunctata]
MNEGGRLVALYRQSDPVAKSKSPTTFVQSSMMRSPAFVTNSKTEQAVTEEIFRISIRSSLAVARQPGVNLANTGKRRIFFYLLSSIIPFGSARFVARRALKRSLTSGEMMKYGTRG